MTEKEVGDTFGAGPGDYSGFKGMTKRDWDRVGWKLHQTRLLGAEYTWKMWATPEVAIIIQFVDGRASKPLSFCMRLEHNTPVERILHVLGCE